MKWPKNKKFTVCLTHDIDEIRKTYHYITHFLKTLNFSSIKYEKNPYWNFETIMRIEKKYGVKSTFFFLNESCKINLFDKNTWICYLNKYDINSLEIAEVIKKLDERGWEIGVHGSYYSYDDKKLLIKEKRELENIVGHKIIGIRQHYLKLKIPLTWRLQKEVGFRYDCSFGFNRKVGFRDDKYLPFRPFNDSFVVIPLAIMDSVLFKGNPKIEDAWKKCKEMISLTKKKGGVLTVLWHNVSFNKKEYGDRIKVYEKLIKECKKEGAWFAKGKEVADLHTKFKT